MAWAAVQDHSGVMYFGCDTVVSFDGERWHALEMDATYAVRGLDVGPNGRIWAAGVNQIGWFESKAAGKLSYYSLNMLLPREARDLGDVWRVYATGNDSAVFVAQDTVLRWDGHAFKVWVYPGARMLWSTRTAKGIYFHYRPIGLFKMGPEGPMPVISAAAIGLYDIRWLDDSVDPWLILTAKGFASLNTSNSTAIDSEASSFVRANVPTSAVRLVDGTLAVGTLHGGIALLDQSGKVRRILNHESGLPANTIYALFVDSNGALWSLGPSHIVRLALNSGVTLFGPQNGYPSGGCNSLAEFRGVLFASSENELLQMSLAGSGRQEQYFAPTGFRSSRIYSLLSLPYGVAIAHLRGLDIWSTDRIEPIVDSGDIVFRVTPSQSKNGELLASQTDRIFSVNMETGHLEVVAEGLPDYGDTLAEEPSGRLWIGTPSRGLFVAEPRNPKVSPASPRFGQLSSAGSAFVSRSGGNIIVLTHGSAYSLNFRADRFESVQNFPGGNPIAVSNTDSLGSVWYAVDPPSGGTVPKLGKISVQGGVATWIPGSIEGLSEIGSLLCLYSSRSTQGDVLWISGSEGLAMASSHALAPCSHPPRPVLRGWYAAADGSRGTLEGLLPYSTQGIHTEFCSPDFGKREIERFQTMLGGADVDWSPPSNTAERDFSGLREGAYSFKVRLVSDSGEVGDPAELSFAIASPWWRTAWAYGAIAVLAILAIGGLNRMRVDSLRQRAAVLEETVRRRTADLEKANAAKTDFIASMSHEIRNPMGGILGTALELAETPLCPEQQVLVSTLRSCASFLASLVEDVLDFAAIEAGAIRINRIPYSPVDVLEGILKMLETRPQEAELKLSVDPTLPTRILGDPARVQQVMVNFTLNALKFGGANIELSARIEDRTIIYSVADDGPGIAFEDQKNLFVRFSRLKSTRNSAIPGTGLGLAGARVLADLMGGSVGVISSPGEGSTFYMRLTLEPVFGSEAEPEVPNHFGGRALVVEDVAYNARALAVMLNRLGFVVEHAANGREAIEHLSNADYQAVFLDCDLPGIDGKEVARWLRIHEKPPRHAWVVATTAYTTVDDERACISAGMDAFLAKPITPQKLKKILSTSFNAGGESTTKEVGIKTEQGIDLTLLRTLSDGTQLGIKAQVAEFTASIETAAQAISDAHAASKRVDLSIAAHRIITLARMVDASELASKAADLQDFAPVYGETELAKAVAAIEKLTRSLKAEVEAAVQDRDSRI